MGTQIKVTMASVRQALFDLTRDGKKWVIVPEVAVQMGYEGEVSYHGCSAMIRGCLAALVQVGKIAQSRIRPNADMPPGTGGRRPVEFQILPGGLSQALPENKERRTVKVDGTPRKVSTEPKARAKLSPSKLPNKKTEAVTTQPVRFIAEVRLPVRRNQSVASLRKLVALAESIADYAAISDNACVIELTLID